MKALLTTTMALGVVLALGSIQPVNATVIGPSGSDYQQGQLILAHGHGGGGGHWGGGGGHWGGGHGFGHMGHEFGHHHHGWDGGGYFYGGPIYDYGYDYGPYDDDGGSICVGPFCADID
ncbi:MAG: hypothetical protein BGO67_10945 [Alphaproteobacteria bacterium 41-28]|nr:MAG: hypothetical protein BGO67_10945 [Alphaproteobacteria bacterium 41-28]